MENIAQTIVQQLGNVTLAMLGANKLVDAGNSLQFGIKGSKRCNKIVIELMADDTYTISTWKVGRVNFKKVGECDGVYVDNLHTVIQDLTGLYTRM